MLSLQAINPSKLLSLDQRKILMKCVTIVIIQDKCFFLHGYPDWHRLYGKTKPKLRPVGSTVKKAAQVSVKTSESADAANADVITKDVFSEAQCEQLTRMIQNSMKTMDNWNTTSHLSGIHSVFSAHNAYTVHTKPDNITWILDSGATDHIVSDISLLNQSKPVNAVLHLPNGTTASITHVGNAVLTSSIVLTEVLCVPSFHCNLVSISKLTANSSMNVLFSKFTYLLQDLSLKQMVEIGRLDARLYSHTASHHLCNRVHSEPSIEVPTIIQNFVQLIKTQFNTNIKIIRSDNCTEFVNNNLQQFFLSAGILHQTSCSHTPQQNGGNVEKTPTYS